MPDVGRLRQACALADSDTPVVIVSDDPALNGLEVLEVYPDQTNVEGKWTRSFKVKVAPKRRRDDEKNNNG